MTEAQLLTQNEKGFEGDSYIAQEVEKLVKQFNVSLIVETGTYLGNTTKRLSELAKVISIEVNEEHYNKAKANINGNENINLYKGNSVKVLDMLLPVVGFQNILFFLDAHWEDYCPLVDEIKTIAKYNIKPVICIHDFKVPGKPFGYDTYKGQAYEWDWIKPYVEAIYGNNYKYYYNEKAEGAKRGVIYIHES